MNREPPSNTICRADCPVRATADIVEHKWATLIVRDLLSGKKRFSELERSLVSISPKVLSERLKELEAKEIVCRTVFPTVPPTTEYELTAIGKEFETVIRAMQDFGTLLLKSAESPE
jgi:DNA-binding HxlR family transcriptional regulator